MAENPGPKILRSSEPGEDWFDPRSGVHQSSVLHPQKVQQIIEEQAQQIWFEARQNQVLQDYVWGCGCVIDVGFSELLERPVIRVAKGNPNFIHGTHQFTSATWDHESFVAIYDAESGEHIAGSQLGFRNYESPFTELVQELIHMLACADFSFGLQLEVILDPLADFWHLVQIRPSPGVIRGMKTRPETIGKLVSTTGKVNQVGDVSGPVMYAGDEAGRDHSVLGKDLYHAIGVIQSGRGEIEPTLTGKILHWDFGVLLRYKYQPTVPILAAALMGAIGQTSRGHLFGNSAHESYRKYDGKEKEWYERGFLSGMQLGRISDEFERMIRGNKGSEVNVRLVSDGLVGQVYQLD